MPNRILRDWTDSYAVNELDAHEERFFVRLIMKVDDFGRFHADVRLLKANLFPLLPETRDTDISHWLAACEKAGLLRCYVDVRGRQFLEIQNFRQRTRQMKAKFPPLDEPQAVGRLPDDGQVTVNGRSIDRQLRTETETETETKRARARKSFGPVGGSPSTGQTDSQSLGERLQDLFPVLATNRPQLEGVFATLQAREWTAETLDGWRGWYRQGWPRSQMSHFNLLNTVNDYDDHRAKSQQRQKREYCGNCNYGWLPPAEGEERVRPCPCAPGETEH